MIVDCLRKMTYFVLDNKTITKQERSGHFLDNLYQYHGLLDNIILNQKPPFISKFWRSFFEILNAIINFFFTFHPQMDGQIECVNQVLEQYLYCNIKYQRDD